MSNENTTKEAWGDFEELRNLKLRIQKFESALTADNQTIRLAMGELTPQEMRNVRAAFNWVLAKSKEN